MKYKVARFCIAAEKDWIKSQECIDQKLSLVCSLIEQIPDLGSTEALADPVEKHSSLLLMAHCAHNTLGPSPKPPII